MAINWNTQPTPKGGIKWNAAPVTPAKPQEPDMMHKVASGLNTVFGGGKIGDAIGTQIAKLRATPEERKYIEDGPSAKEVIGDVIRTGATFIPGAAGASLGAKVATGLATGYAYDVGNDMAENKSLKEIVTPGAGTVIGGIAPVVLHGAVPLAQGIRKGLTKGTQLAAEKGVESVIKKRVERFDTVFNTSGPLRRLKQISDSKGYNLSDTFANNDRYIPDGGKQITYDSIAKPIENIQTDIQSRAKVVDALVESSGKKVRLDDWKNATISQLEDLKYEGASSKKVREKVEADFESWRNDFADAQGYIDIADVNRIKSKKYGVINDWKSIDPNLWTADRTIARSAKEFVEQTIDGDIAQFGGNVRLKELNYELGRLYDAQDALEQMAKSGVTLEFGRAGRWAARGLGAIAGAQGGVIGSTSGVIAADSIVSLMQMNYFKKNPTLTKLLGEIQQKEPEMFAEAARMAEQMKQRPVLPPDLVMPKDVTPGTLDLGRKKLPTLNGQIPVKNAQSTPALPQNLSNSQLPTTNPTNAIPNSAIPPTVPPKGPQSSLPSGQLFGGLAGIKEDENGNLTLDPKAMAVGLAGGLVSKKVAARAVDRLSKERERILARNAFRPKTVNRQDERLRTIDSMLRKLSQYL